MFIAIYIDDLFLFNANINPRIDNIMQNHQDRFQITNLSNVFHYFGIEIDINLNKKTISLQQSAYLKKILGQYRITNYKSAKISISFKVANFLTSYKN